MLWGYSDFTSSLIFKRLSPGLIDTHFKLNPNKLFFSRLVLQQNGSTYIGFSGIYGCLGIMPCKFSKWQPVYISPDKQGTLYLT